MSTLNLQTKLAFASLAVMSVFACSDDGTRATSSGSTTSGSTSGMMSSGQMSSGTTSSGTSGTTTKGKADISGDISADMTLSNAKDYTLQGLVRVKSGATLTIEKGTTIYGAIAADKTNASILLIEAGAKIVAQGTADEPIVFTSEAAVGVRRAGDWGGVVVLGNAPVNYRDKDGKAVRGAVEGVLSTTSGINFGGDKADDNSGVISFVRIEYAGYALSMDNEVNGLTLAGVGRGTKLDHVQVRHALDDCFEFFGGTVDAKYLACQYNQDDGFDFDNGYQGRLQFLVLQQDPNHAGEDNGFESDNDATGSANEPFTQPQVYNATVVGKNKSVDAVQYGLLLRRNSRGTYRNILALGFEAGVDVRDKATAEATKLATGGLSFANGLMFGMTGTALADGIVYSESSGDKAMAPNYDNDANFDELAWLKGNSVAFRDPGIGAPFNANSPVFGGQAMPGATPPSDGFFDVQATYVGAFKDAADTWATSGKWATWSDK
jgi:hypothetical protein